MCQNTCRNAFLNHGNFCNLTQYSSLDDKSSVLSKNMWFCCSKHTKPWGSSFKLLEKWMSKFLMPWSSIHNTGGFSRLSFWLRIETKTRSANSNRLYHKKCLLLMLSKHRAQKAFNQRGPASFKVFPPNRNLSMIFNFFNSSLSTMKHASINLLKKVFWKAWTSSSSGSTGPLLGHLFVAHKQFSKGKVTP